MTERQAAYHSLLSSLLKKQHKTDTVRPNMNCGMEVQVANEAYVRMYGGLVLQDCVLLHVACWITCCVLRHMSCT